MSDEIENLKKQLAEIESVNKILDKAHADSHAREYDLINKLAQVEKHLHWWKITHPNDLAEKLAKAEAENARLKHINPIVDQVERLETENARLQEKVEGWVCEEEYRNEYKLRTALKERIADLEAENARLNRENRNQLDCGIDDGQKIEQLEAEAERMKKKFIASESENARLYKEMHDLQVDHDLLFSKIDRLERQLKIAMVALRSRNSWRETVAEIEALENEKGGG